MFSKSYQIILMSYPDGEWIHEYYSYIVPMVNDVIIDDTDEIHSSYIAVERHFSIRSQKVILLVEKIDDVVETTRTIE